MPLPVAGEDVVAMQQKEPSTGFMLELLGLVGFLGIGHIWAGRALRGVLLMFGYWLILLFMTILPVLGILAASVAGYISGDVFAGCLLLACSYLLVPIASGVWLRNELRTTKRPPDIIAPPATPQNLAPTLQDLAPTLAMTQPFDYTQPPPPPTTPSTPLTQSPLIYQPHFQSPYTAQQPDAPIQATPERKPAVGLLELLFLYVGPITFIIGVGLSARREFSDGTVEHFTSLWPLGIPLEILGVISLLVFAGLAIFRKHT